MSSINCQVVVPAALPYINAIRAKLVSNGHDISTAKPRQIRYADPFAWERLAILANQFVRNISETVMASIILGEMRIPAMDVCKHKIIDENDGTTIIIPPKSSQRQSKNGLADTNSSPAAPISIKDLVARPTDVKDWRKKSRVGSMLEEAPAKRKPGRKPYVLPRPRPLDTAPLPPPQSMDVTLLPRSWYSTEPRPFESLPLRTSLPFPVQCFSIPRLPPSDSVQLLNPPVQLYGFCLSIMEKDENYNRMLINQDEIYSWKTLFNSFEYGLIGYLQSLEIPEENRWVPPRPPVMMPKTMPVKRARGRKRQRTPSVSEISSIEDISDTYSSAGQRYESCVEQEEVRQFSWAFEIVTTCLEDEYDRPFLEDLLES